MLYYFSTEGAEANFSCVKGAALATLMYKTSHIARPELGPYEGYGWSQADDKLTIRKISLARTNDQEHILWLHKRLQQEVG